MRIGIDYTAAVWQGAGIGRYTRELIGALASRTGHELRLCYPARGLGPQDRYLPQLRQLCAVHRNVRAVPIPLSPQNLTRIWQRLRLPLRLELLAGRLDVVHAPDFALPPTAARTVLTVHDLSYLLFPQFFLPSLTTYLNRVVPYALSRADLVLADSLATRADLHRHLGVDPQRVTVLYPGVSPHFKPLPAALCEPVRQRLNLPDRFFLFVSTLSPRKNLVRLLEAFAAMTVASTSSATASSATASSATASSATASSATASSANEVGSQASVGEHAPASASERAPASASERAPERAQRALPPSEPQASAAPASASERPPASASERPPASAASVPHLVLAGQRGWLYEEVFAAIERLHLTERVRVLDFVSDEDLPALYNLAEATLYPSVYEGFGLPVLEALACGSPVLTATNSSLPEVAGDAALLVEATDTAAIAAGITRLSSDAALRAQLRAAGPAQAARFRWDHAADQLLASYEALCPTAPR